MGVELKRRRPLNLWSASGIREVAKVARLPRQLTLTALLCACTVVGSARAGSGLAGDKLTSGIRINDAGSIHYPVTIPGLKDGSPALECNTEAYCVLVASSYFECGWLEAMGASDDAAAMCNLQTAVWQYCDALWPGKDSATWTERNRCQSRLTEVSGFHKWYREHDHS